MNLGRIASVSAFALLLCGCGEPSQPTAPRASGTADETTPSTDPSITTSTIAGAESAANRALTDQEIRLDQLLKASLTRDVVGEYTAELLAYNELLSRYRSTRAASQRSASDASAVLKYYLAQARLEDESTLFKDVDPLIEAGEYTRAVELLCVHPLYRKRAPDTRPRLEAAIVHWSAGQPQPTVQH